MSLPLFRTWQWWAEQDSGADFLIDGLIHSSATLVSGRPEAGKTTLVAMMTAAIASGREAFLGRTIHRHGPVLISATDPGEASKWGRRMKCVDPSPTHEVLISRHDSTTDWEPILAEVKERQPVLFVLDNALGVMKGDVRSNDVAAPILRGLTGVIELGTAAVLVHHSSAGSWEKNGEDKPRGPMGSTAYGAWARHRLDILKSGDQTLSVESRGNDTAPYNLSVDVTYQGDGTATYALASNQLRADKRPRAAETLDKRQAFVADRIVGNPNLREAHTQKAVAVILGVNQSQVQRSLATVPGATWKAGTGWVLENPP